MLFYYIKKKFSECVCFLLYYISKIRYSHYLLTYGFLFAILTHTSVTAHYSELQRFKMLIRFVYTIPIIAGLLLNTILYKGGKIFINKYMLYIFLFFIASVFSIGANLDMFKEIILNLMKTFFPFITCFAIIQTLKREDIDKIAIGFCLFIILNVFVSFVQMTIFSGNIDETTTLTSAFFTNRNMYTRALVIGNAYLLIKFIKPKHRWHTIAIFPVLILILINLVLLFSRTGYLLYVITSSIVIYWLGNRKVKKYAVVFSAFIVVIFSLMTLKRIKETKMDVANFSDLARVSTYKAGFNMFISNPIFGIGYGNHSKRFFEYEDKNQVGLKSVLTIHNDLLTVAAETGIIGLTFYMLLNFSLIFELWKRIRDRKRENKIDSVNTEIFCFIWLFTILLSGLLHPPLYYRGIYWLGIAVCIVTLRFPKLENPIHEV